MKKLDNGDKHLLRLIVKDSGEDKWCKVSEPVWPLLINLLDEGFITVKTIEDQRLVKLTQKGENIIEAMNYL